MKCIPFSNNTFKGLCDDIKFELSRHPPEDFISLSYASTVVAGCRDYYEYTAILILKA